MSFPRQKQCAMSTQLLSGPIIDKFFASGAMAACVGGAVLGASLWAMLNGVHGIAANFEQLRTFHVYIEFYLFFGLFISGFLLHMGPRILQTPRGSGPFYLLIILTLAAGCLIPLFSSSSAGIIWSRLFLSMPFVVLLCQFLYDLTRAPADVRRMFGPWLVTSLLMFSVASWMPLTNAFTALGVIWIAVAAITLAAGRAFIIGALNGRRMSAAENAILYVLFCIAGAGFVWQFWHGAGLMAAVCLIYYIRTTKCIVPRAEFEERHNHAPILNVAFTLGYVWAIVGAINLAMVGAGAVDATIHLWVLGWISTLVIGISSQMTRALTGAMPLSEKQIITLLIVWQLAPLLRGFGHQLRLGNLGPFTLIVVTWLVLLVWSGAVLTAVIRLWSKMRSRPNKLQPFVTSA